MKNLIEFIQTLSDGKSAFYPDMSLPEAKLVVDLAVHATNFLTPYGGISGYENLVGTLYRRISMDHGEAVATRLFSEVVKS